MTQYPITVRDGDAWDGLVIDPITINGVPADLAGCTATMQVRAASSTEVLLDLRSDADVPAIAGGDASVTVLPIAAMDITPGSWRWDLELRFPDGRVRTWIGGPFRVLPSITNRTYA